MKTFMAMSRCEVAIQLGLSVDRVKQIGHNAFRKIKRRLRTVGRCLDVIHGRIEESCQTRVDA